MTSQAQVMRRATEVAVACEQIRISCDLLRKAAGTLRFHGAGDIPADVILNIEYRGIQAESS